LNTSTTPARVGDIISLYLTGEGLAAPTGMDGKPASPHLLKPVIPVTVMIGGTTADVPYAGGAPGLVAGVMQINAQIPAVIQTGSAVPVVVTIAAPGISRA